MNRMFIIVSNADPRIMTDVAFPYVRNASRNGWMNSIRLILWGPSQKSIVQALELKAAIMDLLKEDHVEIWACKQCSEDYQISDKLEQLGVIIKYIGEDISEMLKEGWYQLTF
ncbi:MAG: DsrE family protein [Promethearchaeota archaeon]